MMKRDLDEIEMEMGKERTMKYVCDHVGVCEHTGCSHRCGHEDKGNCASHTDFYKCRVGSKCIPVEPERVWYCAEPGILCGLPPCPENCGCYCPGLREGVKVAPSSGLLQRMGMATWDWLEEPKQLYICDHVDGCKRKGCAHRIAHRCGVLSHACRHAGTSGKCVPVESVDTAHCIPYQEERDWFIARKAGYAALTEQEAMERVRSTTSYPGYRAFRWQDGLR